MESRESRASRTTKIASHQFGVLHEAYPEKLINDIRAVALYATEATVTVQPFTPEKLKKIRQRLQGAVQPLCEIAISATFENGRQATKSHQIAKSHLEFMELALFFADPQDGNTDVDPEYPIIDGEIDTQQEPAQVRPQTAYQDLSALFQAGNAHLEISDGAISSYGAAT